jgi:hypothetical protein
VIEILINRAAVLTLWASVVAERLGFEHAEALTLGRAVAGLNAYSKGQALGLLQPTPPTVRAERRKASGEQPTLTVELLHRAVPITRTESGLRALSKGKAIDPGSVERYLASKFGDRLGGAVAELTALARSRPREVLAQEAYSLYEQFRPDVPSGEAGWGATGALSLCRIRSLV